MSKKIENINTADENKGIISCQDDDPTDLGILQEVGNIGAGHAATSLSTVLMQEVSIDLPKNLQYTNAPCRKILQQGRCSNNSDTNAVNKRMRM